MPDQRSLLSFLRSCSVAFELGDDYPLADRVLQPLFQVKRLNTDSAAVLGKAVALNSLYRAGILDIYTMAGHIHRRGRHLDKLLAQGDPGAVALIRRGHGLKWRKRREYDFYSFATKYCHWHRPDRYPIYDSYAVVALKSSLRFMGAESQLQGVDLKDFKVFRDLVDAATTAVGWPHAGYKRFDQALWIMGQVLDGQLSRTMRNRIGPPPRGLRRI